MFGYESEVSHLQHASGVGDTVRATQELECAIVVDAGLQFMEFNLIVTWEE